MHKGKWEHFDHPADIGVRGRGPSCADAFVQGALALVAVLLPPEQVEARQVVAVDCSAAERDYLFVDWLNALLYEMDTRHMLFSRFEVRFTDTGLTGRAWGQPLDPRRHRPAVQVKAATLTELKVEEQADGTWVAQCVVDV
jgi:tRNA nucleotidyltransferase (CCA-adding enzyme)